MRGAALGIQSFCVSSFGLCCVLFCVLLQVQRAERTGAALYIASLGAREGASDKLLALKSEPTEGAGDNVRSHHLPSLKVK
jgi:hypothetical protein